MIAYSVPIVQPRCVECGQPATVEVRNGRNEVIGARCKMHGAQLVAKLNRSEP